MTDLKPTFERYYPEGSKQGQCAAFAEKLVQFGPVGDTLASKTAYVKSHGIPVAKLGGDFRAGDVVVTSEAKDTGHVFVVNCVIGDSLRATESNFNLDGRVHHTRLIPKSSKAIVGVIRAPLKVTIINPMPNFPITIKIKIVSNVRWQSLQDKLAQIKNWYSQKSGGKIDIQFDPAVVFTDLANIPFKVVWPQYETQAPDEAWYDANVFPYVGLNHAVVFILDPKDRIGVSTQGVVEGYTYPSGNSPKIPAKVVVMCDENEDSYWSPETPAFVNDLEHEISHVLFSVSNESNFDRTHTYFMDQRNPEGIFTDQFFDYNILSTNLTPRTPIKIRFIGWNDPEQGLYIPFDSESRERSLIGRLTSLFPDYELDPTEYNLGKRPWK